MTAEGQEFVMADIARLRDAGRVESLRENRDHFHVFAFIDGRRPAEELIEGSLGRSATVGIVKESRPAEHSEKKKEKAAVKNARARGGR